LARAPGSGTAVWPGTATTGDASEHRRTHARHGGQWTVAGFSQCAQMRVRPTDPERAMTVQEPMTAGALG
jgi:hypothetical protein